MKYSAIKKDINKKIRIFNITKSYLELHEYIFNLSTKDSIYCTTTENIPSLHDLKKLKLTLENLLNYDDSVEILIDQAIYYGKLAYKRILIYKNFTEYSCKKKFSNEDKNYINSLIMIKLKFIREKMLIQNSQKINSFVNKEIAFASKNFFKILKNIQNSLTTLSTFFCN